MHLKESKLFNFGSSYYILNKCQYISVVVITDGVSNVLPDQTLVEAELLKRQGVHVYAIGIGHFDAFEINHIASDPASENAFVLKDYSLLKDISSSIVRLTCRGLLLLFFSSPVILNVKVIAMARN